MSLVQSSNLIRRSLQSRVNQSTTRRCFQSIHQFHLPTTTHPASLYSSCRSFTSTSIHHNRFTVPSSHPPPPPSPPPVVPPVYIQVSSTPSADSGTGSRLRHAFIKMASEKMPHFFVVIGVVAVGFGLVKYFGWEDVVGKLQPNVGSNNRFPMERPTTRLRDVVGCDEAKSEVVEVIEYLKDPSKFNRLGGKMPKGVLLLGPPGTGKTLLARAIAGEAGVPFFAATGADFEEMFVGVGAKRVRELFAEAKKVKPSIIFIDEIDTVGGKRNEWDHPKARMSLNQLLTELDGFQEATGIIVIGATNFANKLDPALLRPGRFDRHVTMSPPDVKGRKSILELYAKKLKLDPKVDLGIIARGTSGMTGADLFHLLNTASLRASTLNKQVIDLDDLEHAKDKILMGAERLSAVNSPEVKKHIAYYEGGKSLTALLTPKAEPIHKVTIIQRGGELGKTQQQRGSDDDQTSMSYEEYLADLDVHMGGRVAEEIIFGPNGITNCAYNDLRHATLTARQMVSAFGYGPQTGLTSHANTDFSNQAAQSTKLDIDHEIQSLLSNSHQRVKQKLEAHKSDLHTIARALLEQETLDGTQLKQLVHA